MIKRPKADDTETDILQMQNAFLAEKEKNLAFQPAAKLVKIEPAKKQSKFAQERAKRTAETSKAEPSTEKPNNIIIGNIVERTECNSNSVKTTIHADKGFPQPQRIDKKLKLNDSANQSLFAQSLMKSDGASSFVNKSISHEINKTSFGVQSHVIENAEATSIHKENVEFLQKMGEAQILEERKRLLGSVDPSLVAFLKEKRKSKLTKIAENSSQDVRMTEVMLKPDILPEIDVLKDESSRNWLHFDVIEPSKLEWMRDLPNNMPELKPGEQYEARFDWKGVLLPFNIKDDNEKSASTDLFLHGDDAHRPGYTLQELFRLARSTVVQQRISALGAIGGILSIYNQGYYDGIFELPISKIFFLLRYAFDDNTLAMLEVSAKALSTLFFNETDEILLDMIYDCSFDCIEPTLEIRNDDTPKTKSNNLEEQFNKMNIESNLMQTNVTDDDDDDKLSSMNDFHLAETDLIQCLLRTNILQRFTYIFTLINSENSTKMSCVKILIRLARTSEDVAKQILSHSDLIDALIDQFSTIVNNEDRNQSRMLNSTKVFILKLFRIICSYGKHMINQLCNRGLNSVLKLCIFVQENSITVETVKNQIEALRCVRAIVIITASNELINDLLPALCYTLEWIYQFVIFQDENHFLFRQCASALIALLSTANAISFACDKLSLCFSKWFTMAAQHGNLELSQIVLLATCLNAIENANAFPDFLKNYLPRFLYSSTYMTICNSLSKSSGILSSYKFRQQDHKPLPHLHSIVFNARNSPVFIVSDRPTIYIISSIVRLFNATKFSNDGTWLNDGILQYIENFANATESKTALNWFLRQEIIFVLDILKSSLAQSQIDRNTQLQLAYKVVTRLTENQINDLLQVFSQFIFNIEMYPNRMDLTPDNMNDIKSAYGKICVEHFLSTIDEQQKRPHEHFDRIPMLAMDWPGMLLLKMYKTPDQFQNLELLEKDVITTTITFLLLQNVNNLAILNKTEQFIYTMISYLGKENAFLDADIKNLLENFVRSSFKSQDSLDFDKFAGKFNFENLYISFLDQFQGVSYSDFTFGRLVMVPLAQKHNIKWRQMIWSEHVHVLRFVSCLETELIGDFNDYIQPSESDVILLKSYYQAINSSTLIPNKAPYKIAQHHYNAYKAKIDQKKMDTS